MSQLFGFQINRKEGKKGASPVPPSADEPVAVAAGGYFGTYVDLDNNGRDEFELIRRYRDMALHPEVDSAVDEVVNEFVVNDNNDSCVDINLENLELGAGVKKKIREEFGYIKRLLNFDDRAHEIIRNWYVDGRIFYHKVIDLEAPKKGILELRYIDPLKIKKIRQKTKQQKSLTPAEAQSAKGMDWGGYVDYYLYNPRGYIRGGALGPVGDMSNNQGIKMATDSITFCSSGLQDLNKRLTLSFLHKAIKSLNQLRMIEDALVIYRLSRAPERRIFYIDVGNLPKVKAEQYLRDVMMRYRNKLVYDSNSGEIRDDKKMMSMLEDFWLPRREGGRGTEITTLPGGQNLGELADIEYFQSKLYRSLGVPESRIAGSGDGFNLGRSSEILRDELKFSKFVGRLRKRFSNIFLDMLKSQLLLKNIVTPQDWEVMSEHIQFDFIYDNHFAELKDKELMEGRLGLLGMIEPYVGRYYSTEYVRRQVLRQRDAEIAEIDVQIENEIASGVIPDPNQQMLEMEAMAAADPMLQGQEDPAALPPGQAPNPQNAEPPQGQGEI